MTLTLMTSHVGDGGGKTDKAPNFSFFCGGRFDLTIGPDLFHVSAKV